MLKDSYRKIFIVESINTWQFDNEYDATIDLVLTLDFGLKSLIQSHGGEVYYLDALGKTEILQSNNLILIDFLQKWFLSEKGEDLFVYKGIKFGKSLRIAFWSELMFFLRICISLEEIQDVKYERLVISENSNHIKKSLNAIKLEFENRSPTPIKVGSIYFFDIHRYMNEALMNDSLKFKAIRFYQFIYSRLRLYFDELAHKNIYRISVQVYHPTLKVIEQLRRTPGVQVITSGYAPAGKAFSLLRQRLFLVPASRSNHRDIAEAILMAFHSSKKTKMVLASGRDISNNCYDLIYSYINGKIPEALGEIDSALRFQQKKSLDLNVCISSLGIANTIFNEVSRLRGVKSLFIANGLLNSRFSTDEGLDFDFLNCYSSSIKQNYFHNSPKAFALGDSRMDAYGTQTPFRVIDRENPTIVIGASGFCSTDFNSFAAIEFEFLSDVLNAINEVPSYSKQTKIVIKVRPNGYLAQYQDFVFDYFPFLNISILQEVKIIDLLDKCDLYISIASQTLFEASCLGIPVIYYKNDRESLDPPFDSLSELPTFHTSHELANALNDFRLSRDNFCVFQNREVMSKYIGPLDGQNLKRNIDFIMKLISTETV